MGALLGAHAVAAARGMEIVVLVCQFVELFNILTT
jgi:hypothetical protein